jgi:hypothetical protein
MSEPTNSAIPGDPARKHLPRWALIPGGTLVLLIAFTAIGVAINNNPNRDVAQQDKNQETSQATLNKYMGSKPVTQSRVVKKEPLRSWTEAERNHSYLQAVYAGSYKTTLANPLAELRKIGFHCSNIIKADGTLAYNNDGLETIAYSANKVPDVAGNSGASLAYCYNEISGTPANLRFFPSAVTFYNATYKGEPAVLTVLS